jgi:hypothetical protein
MVEGSPQGPTSRSRQPEKESRAFTASHVRHVPFRLNVDTGLRLLMVAGISEELHFQNRRVRMQTCEPDATITA